MTAAALAAAAGAAPSQSPPSAPLPVKAHVTQEDKIWAKDKLGSGPILPMQQANAMFGLSGGSGDVNKDTFADLFVSAILEDDGGTLDVGRAYVFRGDPALPLSNNPRRLTPPKTEAGQHTGERSIVCGTLTTGNDPNLAFVPSWNRSLGSLRGVGAVDAYCLTGNSDEKDSIFLGVNPPNHALVPPPDPPGSPTQGQVVARSFGHCMVLADLDGDGRQDLVVGAHNSEEGRGRVYVFWSEDDPENAPYGINLLDPLCTILKRPGVVPPEEECPANPDRSPNGGFGFWLAAGNLDPDPDPQNPGMGNPAELVVAEPMWPNNDTCNPLIARRGVVHLFTGGQVPKPAPSGPRVLLTTVQPASVYFPPPPHNSRKHKENFGFYLWMLDWTGDGRTDLVIHGESTDWPGPNEDLGIPPGAPPSASGAGALYLYRNNEADVPGSPGLAHDFRVVFSSDPAPSARFGKHVARMPAWLDTSANPPVSKPGLLITEPDTMATSTSGARVVAGVVHFAFLESFLTLPISTPSRLEASWTIENTLMDDFGVGQGPEEHEVFGRWLEVGNFTGNFGPSQFVVTASHRDVPHPTQPLPAVTVDAGAAVHVKQP